MHQLHEKFVNPPLPYRYEAEAFRVRVKDFWPLFRARKVLEKMIPGLCHDADGLILQVCSGQSAVSMVLPDRQGWSRRCSAALDVPLGILSDVLILLW